MTTMAKGGRFRIYDGMLYKGKPSLAGQGLLPIKVLYPKHLWSKNADRSVPDIPQIKKVIQEIVQEGTERVVLDLEGWGVETSKYLAALNAAKSVGKFLDYGFYGQLPQRSHPYRIKRETNYWHEIQGRNAEMAQVAYHANTIYPSLYNLTVDGEEWEAMALRDILAARKYGREVIPFIMPQYHPNSAAPWRFLDYDKWVSQLSFLSQISEGVIIWSPPDPTWDNKSPWWDATKLFLQQF